MIFTIGNTKGGVGKSTLALNLAIALASRGRRVWIVDGDRQGTTSTAMSIRAAAGKLPLIHCSHIVGGLVAFNGALLITERSTRFDAISGQHFSERRSDLPVSERPAPLAALGFVNTAFRRIQGTIWRHPQGLPPAAPHWHIRHRLPLCLCAPGIGADGVKASEPQSGPPGPVFLYTLDTKPGFALSWRCQCPPSLEVGAL